METEEQNASGVEGGASGDAPSASGSWASPARACRVEPADAEEPPAERPRSGRIRSPSGSPSGLSRSTPAAQQDDPRIGETLASRYRLDRLIGKGGMGRIYRATQLPLNRPVAVKLLSSEFRARDPQFVRRFFLEASAAARLSHPNTITVFDYGESANGELFIVMEYLRGRPLARVLREDGPLPPARALGIATQVCRALREAHGKGIVHRDLKPANIMVIDEGDDADFVKVLDFGLVKILSNSDPENEDDDVSGVGAIEGGELDPPETEHDEDLTCSGLFLGSPKYMSPEQIRGHSLDARTDVYSLGVVLFAMCAGRPPFVGRTSVETVRKHLLDPIPRIRDVAPGVEVPVDLEALIAKCLAKNREHRVASMAELLPKLKAIRRALLGPSMISETGASLVPMDAKTDDLCARWATRAPIARPEGPTASTKTSRPTKVTLSPKSEVDRLDVRGAPPTASTWPEPVRRGGPLRFAPWFGAAALLSGLGLWAVVWTRSPLSDASPSASSPERGPPRPDCRVSFRSIPSGAEVLEDGQPIGRTPFERVFLSRGPDAEPRRFLFRLEGYDDQSVEARLDRPNIEIRVILPESGAPRAVERSERTDSSSRFDRSQDRATCASSEGGCVKTSSVASRFIEAATTRVPFYRTRP